MENTQKKIYIGENMKRARLGAGMTQRQLAEAAGMTQRSIVLLETDRHEPRPSTLNKLSKALGVTNEDLIGDK